MANSNNYGWREYSLARRLEADLKSQYCNFNIQLILIKIEYSFSIIQKIMLSQYSQKLHCQLQGTFLILGNHEPNLSGFDLSKFHKFIDN